MNSPNAPHWPNLVDGLFAAAQFLPRSMNTTNAWCGHLPFAAWMVQQFRPASIVELGTHTGNSYFTMCQAAQAAALETRCYAVDTWQGDEHAGHYSDEVYNAVDAHNQEYYASFSRLLRMTFDDALGYFADGSIELLHIDGLHTYQAVKHDFDSWLPKLAPGGVVMFHDTNVRERGFGVWQLWQELQQRYPNHLEFIHSNGLGVLQLDGAPERKLPWLDAGFDRKEDLIQYFSALGGRQMERFAVNLGREQISALEDNRQHLMNELARAEQEKLETEKEKLETLTRDIRDRRAAQDYIHELERTRHYLTETLQERDRQIEEIQASRSWRITRPLRAVVNLTRGGEPGAPVSGFHRFILRPSHRLLSHVLLVLCLLPASFCHYRPLSAWFAAAFRGKGFFSSILLNPDACRERLATIPGPLRTPISAGLSLAIKLRHRGGLMPLLRSRPPANLVIGDNSDPRRILVADTRIPMEDISAGERSTMGVLRDLSRMGYQVTMLPVDMEPAPRYEAELASLGIEVITKEKGFSSAGAYLARHGHQFGAFYLIRVDVAETLLSTARRVAPNARILFHAPDLYFLREMREAEVLGDPVAMVRAEHTRERELAIMRDVDHVIVLSTAEKPVLEPYLPQKPISLFPALYAAINEDPPPFEERRHIFFLGGFGHRPNRDGVLWFVEAIWPLIHARIPDMEFHIIGAEVPADILTLDGRNGIRVVGYVEDLDPTFNSQRLGVAPLRYGAGIKGKVAMTIGAGVPCICTDVAAEGMHLLDGVHTLLAETPEDFAEAVIRAYTDADLWQQLSVNGREQVRLICGETVNRSTLLGVLNAASVLPPDLFIDYCKQAPARALPTLQQGRKVDVSIIISAHNQWDATRACLNSILETCSGADISYEIILADDASSDDTLQAAQQYPGLTLARADARLGFLRACNQAAMRARGRYLLFLNNNTIVMPGWLAALVEPLEASEDVAIAGSKVLSPEGRIQEAGGRLFNDGSTTRIGQDAPREAPEHNTASEADYVSSVSMLVRRSFWETSDGFDERYDSTGGEDVDLALSAKEQGFRVIYQPTSELVHFPQQVKATQAEENSQEPQARDGRLLLEKWGDAVAADYPPRP